MEGVRRDLATDLSKRDGYAVTRFCQGGKFNNQETIHNSQYHRYSLTHPGHLRDWLLISKSLLNFIICS